MVAGSVLDLDYLIDSFRDDVDDKELPGTTTDGSESDEDSLWSNDTITRYVSNAQIAIARDADYLQDVYVLQYKAATAEYKLPDWIFEIRRAKLWPTENVIRIYDIFGNPVGDDAGWPSSGSNDYGQWQPTMREDYTSGTPRSAVFDEKTNVLRLMGIPEIDGEARIYVRRGPKLSVEAGLELRGLHYEPAYLAHMKMQAYSKHDTETYDPNLAAKWKAQYAEEVFALKREAKIRRGHIPVTRPIW